MNRNILYSATRLSRILAIIIALFVVSIHAYGATPTAASILEKATSAFLKSSATTATYSVKSGGSVQSGNLSVKGKKFVISCGSLSTWYDGKTMWTYNKSDNEVTISSPTSQEISSINPYALLGGYKTMYTAQLQKSAISGTYSILLTPKSGQNPIKKAIVYIRQSDWQPVRLDVTSKSGDTSVIIITNIKTGAKIADNSFIFPSSKYKGVSKIDLR